MQNLRRAQAGEFGGTRVVRVVEQAAGAVLRARNTIDVSSDFGVGGAEALEFARSFIAQHAGDEAHRRIDHDGRGQFAAAQYVVADGKLHVAIEFVDALVDALVAATDENDAVESGKFARDGLVEQTALGGEQNHLRSLVLSLRSCSLAP